MTVDHSPRFVTLHQTFWNGKGGQARSFILDSWYCWVETATFTGKDGRTARAVADYWAARWNREHDDWAAAA